MPRAPGTAAPSAGPPVHSTVLFCEVCGTDTVHRVLRWIPTGAGVEGTARCGTCRWTHPFREAAEVRVGVWVVRSEGTESRRERREVPSRARFVVGQPVAAEEPTWVVRKIERLDHASAAEADARDVATLWTRRETGEIPVSLIDGATTRTTRWRPREGTVVRIGDAVSIDDASAYVIGFRGRGRTWRRAGDELPASEVTRVYARRIRRPPAGRSRWSTSRGMPRSRTSSFSRSARPRSSSGDR